MIAMASQITGVSIVYSAVYSCTSNKTSKLRVTGLCEGNSPVTDEFPSQRASNAEMFPFDDVTMMIPVKCESKRKTLYLKYVFKRAIYQMSAILSQPLCQWLHRSQTEHCFQREFNNKHQINILRIRYLRKLINPSQSRKKQWRMSKI